MYKVDIHCTNLCECPMSSIDVQGRHSLYKPMGMSNIQYRFTRKTFTVQTYNMSVQYWKGNIDIRCTNLCECPTSNIKLTLLISWQYYKLVWFLTLNVGHSHSTSSNVQSPNGNDVHYIKCVNVKHLNSKANIRCTNTYVSFQYTMSN